MLTMNNVFDLSHVISLSNKGIRPENIYYAHYNFVSFCHIYSVFRVCVYVFRYIFVAYFWPNPAETNYRAFSESHLNESLVG